MTPKIVTARFLCHFFNPPQGWLFLLAARHSLQAVSTLAPQRRLAAKSGKKIYYTKVDHHTRISVLRDTHS